MKNKMKRIWAKVLVVMMIFSMAPSALAAEYYSGSLSVGGRVKITPAPTNAPTPAPETQEPEKSAEPEESTEPKASDVPGVSSEPTVEATVSPEVTEEPATEATVSPEVTEEPEAEATVSPEVTEKPATEVTVEPQTTLEPTAEPRAAVVYKKGEDKVAIVREGPSSDSGRVGKAHSGDLVTVFAEQNGWLLVEVNGVRGWMHSGLVSFDLTVTQMPDQMEAPEAEATVPSAPGTEPEQTEVSETEVSAEPELAQMPAFEPRLAMVYKKGENDVAFVRRGPSIDFERVGKVTDGDLLTVLAEKNGWYQVDANGLVGWMSGVMITFDLGDAQPIETPSPAESAEPTVGLEETEAAAQMPEPTFEPIEGLFVNNDADVRLAGDGLSEILVTITAETPVTVIGLEGDWVKVEVDGVIGYVYIDDIASIRDIEGLLPEATPAPEDAEEAELPPIKLTLFSSRRSIMEPGETVTITSKLENAEGYEIKFQWQVDKGNGYEDIPGANGDSYSFAASVETLAYNWQLTVYYRPAVTE